MTRIKLSTLPTSNTNAVHAELYVNSDRDNGVLYLTQSEYDLLIPVLRAGCLETGVEFDEQDDRNSEYEYELD
jgi:hypothetical protein